MDGPAWLKLILSTGLPGATLFALWSLNRGDWLPRRSHEQILARTEAAAAAITSGKDAVIAELRSQLAAEERRADEWKGLVYEGRSLLNTAVTAAKESKA